MHDGIKTQGLCSDLAPMFYRSGFLQKRNWQRLFLEQQWLSGAE